jgi:hypothetical protein
MVLTDAIHVEPHQVGEFDLFEQVPEPGAGIHLRARRGIAVRFGE